jgi:hypothetical protein
VLAEFDYEARPRHRHVGYRQVDSHQGAAAARLQGDRHGLEFRVARRTTNPYGQLPAEVDEVLRFKATAEPLLRRSATLEIDTGQPLRQVVDAIVRRIEPTEGPRAGDPAHARPHK